MRSLLILLACCHLPFPAMAQTQCGPRAEVLSQLETKYAEIPVGMGITEKGVIELTAGPSGFTLIYSLPNGQSCLIADGLQWENLPPVPKGKPS